MAVVHVHIEHPTARSRYVIKQLIERMLGWPLEFVNSTADLAALKGPYSDLNSNRSINNSILFTSPVTPS